MQHRQNSRDESYHWNRETNNHFLAIRKKMSSFSAIVQAQSDLFIRRYFAVDVMLFIDTLMPFIFAMV